MVLFVLLTAAAGAAAHPDHKLMGTVTAIGADHLMLKDRAGKEHHITLTKATKVTKDKKAFKAADITSGTRVVVTVVSDEDLTAKLIEVGVVAPKDSRSAAGAR
jgi:hypothetical protein